jgi:hypothetical protein
MTAGWGGGSKPGLNTPGIQIKLENEGKSGTVVKY